MAEDKVFRFVVECSYPGWWRYNVFLTAVCYDSGGRVADYLTLTDKVWEPGDGTEVRNAPEGYDPDRPLVLETSPCRRAEIYIYVIANTFPPSDVVGQSPPFGIELVVSRDGGAAEFRAYKVNQWGGLTVKESFD